MPKRVERPAPVVAPATLIAQDVRDVVVERIGEDDYTVREVLLRPVEVLRVLERGVKLTVARAAAQQYRARAGLLSRGIP